MRAAKLGAVRVDQPIRACGDTEDPRDVTDLVERRLERDAGRTTLFRASRWREVRVDAAAFPICPRSDAGRTEGARVRGIQEIRPGCEQDLRRRVLRRQDGNTVITRGEPGKNPIVQVSGPDQPILQVERQHHLGGSLIERHSPRGRPLVGRRDSAVLDDFCDGAARGRRRGFDRDYHDTGSDEAGEGLK